MHQEKIYELLNLKAGVEYAIVAEKYQQYRQNFISQKESIKDIRSRIKYQNKMIELDDAFLLYQKNTLFP